MIALSWKYHKLTLVFSFLSLCLYYLFTYELVRSDFASLITLYTALFILYYLIIKKGKYDFLLLVGIAILFRLVLLPAIPNLSQDFYRFLWDGRMLIQGLNPYLITPESYINAGQFSIVPQAQELYAGMGELNGSHYTNYPPLNQLCFAIAALFSGKSIAGSAMALRGIIILADIGIIIVGKKLLQKLGLPIHTIFLYALNPFIIIEMTGNLHFESVMLFFVVWALYMLSKGKWIWSAVLLAFSISVKLLPLLLLPFFLQYFISNGRNAFWLRRDFSRFAFRESVKNLPKLILFYIICIAVIVLSFAPFLTSAFTENFGASIALWFQKFEFNASIYYLIRWYGFQTIGWNIIADVGPKLPIIVIGILLLLTFFRKNDQLIATITAMLLGIFAYFLLSTTVHPWYVATPLILCVFTRYRFPVVWSFTIMLSYSAYGPNGFQENLILVSLEYLLVIGYFIWEIFAGKGNRKLSLFG